MVLCGARLLRCQCQANSHARAYLAKEWRNLTVTAGDTGAADRFLHDRASFCSSCAKVNDGVGGSRLHLADFMADPSGLTAARVSIRRLSLSQLTTVSRCCCRERSELIIQRVPSGDGRLSKGIQHNLSSREALAGKLPAQMRKGEAFAPRLHINLNLRPNSRRWPANLICLRRVGQPFTGSDPVHKTRRRRVFGGRNESRAGFAPPQSKMGSSLSIGRCDNGLGKRSKCWPKFASPENLLTTNQCLVIDLDERKVLSC